MYNSIFRLSHLCLSHNSLSNCALGLMEDVTDSIFDTFAKYYFTHHKVRTSRHHLKCNAFKQNM